MTNFIQNIFIKKPVFQLSFSDTVGFVANHRKGYLLYSKKQKKIVNSTTLDFLLQHSENIKFSELHAIC